MSQKDIELLAWKEFDRGTRWFQHLRIAKDGGFSEVHVLFTKDRFLWALLSIAFIVINLWALFYPNIDALANQPFVMDVDVRQGYIINRLLQLIFGKALNPRVLLAIFELGLLAVLLLRTVILLLPVFTGTPAHKWHGVSRLLWSTLPDLMNFSSMRLLNFVAPSILIPDLSAQFHAAQDRNWGRLGLPLAKFTLVRLLCAFVGFEAFMIKFLDAANTAQASTDSLSSVVVALAFLNQMLGIVQVTPLLQHRLFVYIFGGEDSFMSDWEKAVRQVWSARLTKHIWEAARSHSPGLVWFLAVMLSYGDTDFQRLTLNEHGRAVVDVACGTPDDGVRWSSC